MHHACSTRPCPSLACGLGSCLFNYFCISVNKALHVWRRVVPEGLDRRSSRLDIVFALRLPCMKRPSISRIQEMEGSSRCIQGSCCVYAKSKRPVFGAILYQGGCSFHGVCLGEHTHCSVAIALEGGEATVGSGVDVLVRGLFSLKLTCDIHETGEQLLFGWRTP